MEWYIKAVELYSGGNITDNQDFKFSDKRLVNYYCITTEKQGKFNAIFGIAAELYKTDKYRAYISDIWRQFSVINVRIDILLTIDNYKVIIEDKIGSAATDSQIQAKKNALIAEDVPANQIICVFYKIVPQWWSEPHTGFFEHFINTGLVSKKNWWGYVPNPSGGFMCLCWYTLSDNELEKTFITTKKIMRSKLS